MDLNHLNLRVRDPEACRAFYERHFAFGSASAAEGGYLLRNGDGFLLAVLPTGRHRPLPEGFHIGFGLAHPDTVSAMHAQLGGARVRVTGIEDSRPADAYVTFRCWDPDGTEIEVYWEAEG